MNACSLRVLALLGLAAMQAFAAPASGSPASATCRHALDALREREDRVLAAPRGAVEGERQQMLQARRAAALACLGEADAETPRRVPGAADGLLPAVPLKPLLPPAPRSAGPAVPAPAPALPRTLTTCDANGCWTSDGQRLQRVGPQLLGPRGFCSVAGAAVQCP